MHEGTGFAIVRGLDLDNLTLEDKLVIFLGVADYMGNVRGVQDRRGTMICMSSAHALLSPQYQCLELTDL